MSFSTGCLTPAGPTAGALLFEFALCRAVVGTARTGSSGAPRPSPDAKRLYIETVGCQMNMLDSELVVASLRKAGYELVDDPAKADTILFNTCSVRQHAEDKIYSALGRLKHAKKHNPDKIIGVLGCMAQKDQRLIFSGPRHVDLVVGPGQIAPGCRELLEAVAAGGGPQLEVSLDRKEGSRSKSNAASRAYDPLRDPRDAAQRRTRLRADHDRLRQVLHLLHRAAGARAGAEPAAPQHIVAEARQLADEGCREITLLGQTVNSYRHTRAAAATRGCRTCSTRCTNRGHRRLKFVTNYPKRHDGRPA